MKTSGLLLLFTITIQTPSALSQLFLSGLLDRVSRLPDHAPHRQEPIMNIPEFVKNIPDIVMPPSKEDPGPKSDGDGVIISDVINNERIINIFAGFTRDIDSISKRLDDGSQNATVLAPLNSEILKLPRKPWEDPKDYEELGTNAYGGSEGENRAHQNLRRFVEAHVIPTSPWKEGEKVDSVGGGKVWWENKDDKKIVSTVQDQP